MPLQMSLIPLLRMYNGFGGTDLGQAIGWTPKSYPGIWLAHTGFGLPLAIYLLRNYIGSLPKDIIESAKVDGASHFHIFTRLILPPVGAGAGVLRDLPVPLGVERSAGGPGVPGQAGKPDRHDLQTQGIAGVAWRQLGDP